jgi:hypothetical protein
MKPDRVRIAKLRQLLREALNDLRQYATFFVVEGKLVGSGTFVRVNGIPGILTARHVWDHIVELKPKKVGIQVSEKRHHFSIDLDLLIPMLNLRRRSEAFGPDIEFIRLPIRDAGLIQAVKSFYNLDVDRSKRCKLSSNRLGAQLISGALDEMSRNVGKPNEARGHLVVKVGGLFLERGRKTRRGRFDYWELAVEANANGAPMSYGGVSGGGLWKVIVGRAPLADLSSSKITGIYLSGVVFYQSAMKNERRVLRAHGADVVYKMLPRLVGNTGATKLWDQ